MRIYTKAGDLAFSTFTFPDGQPHFKLETYEIEFRSVTVETAIRNATELLQTLLVAQVLRQHGYSEINLDIRYLLGARMDRAIGPNEPFTLECIARLINSAGFAKVRVLDAHSDVATRLIRNSVNVLPHAAFQQVCTALGNPVIVVPDKGAVPRLAALAPGMDKVFCRKDRDMATGNLTGFSVVDKFHLEQGYDRNFLIADDICDGGGTFVGLYKELRKQGPRTVHLFVTHGIFSKPLPLEGIDTIYTTDSYRPDTYGVKKVVCIPVSMKELA